MPMKRAGDELLARAALSEHEEGRVRFRHPGDDPLNLAHARATPDHLARAEIGELALKPLGSLGPLAPRPGQRARLAADRHEIPQCISARATVTPRRRASPRPRGDAA